MELVLSRGRRNQRCTYWIFISLLMEHFSSFINEEDVSFYSILTGKFVTCDIDVFQYKGNL
ncbi:hypothetical protein, partial [Paenibacillus larvae]|uniref:hypothetical protein n=1 Tax=Paenibacillus larvae TaxID=1464 RepID=UPI001ED96568